MILAIVGSVRVIESQVLRAQKIMRKTIDMVHPLMIVSGGALGIDTVAESEANKLEIEFMKFLPKNDRWEPQGYKERNLQIAEFCDALLCIRTYQSRTYGSGWTADAAEKLGKHVYRHLI